MATTLGISDAARVGAQPWQVAAGCEELEIVTAGGAHVCWCPQPERALQIVAEHNALIALTSAIRNVPLEP